MDMLMGNDEIWQAALAELALQLERSVFNTWLAGTWLVSAESDLFTVGTDNAYARDWLANRLKQRIAQTVSSIAGQTLEVRFVVEKRQEAAEVSKQSQEVAVVEQEIAESDSYTFHGFYAPRSHWVQVPHYLTDDVPRHVKSVTFQLALTIWRQTWGVINARGEHRLEWISHVTAIVSMTGLSINSVKTGIREGRNTGLIVLRGITSAEERAAYECSTGAKLHTNTTLFALRPRWDDEPVDCCN